MPGEVFQPSATREFIVSELAVHNKRQDAWIAIKGKIFNITDYIKSHPGGMAPISKGFGKDATALFNQVHAYVNFEKILAGKQMGVLVAKKSAALGAPPPEAAQGKDDAGDGDDDDDE